jgi:hypothetical protein
MGRPSSEATHRRKVDSAKLKRLDQAEKRREGRVLMPDKTTNPDKKVVVQLNEQQEVILKRLKEDGRYGATDGEIIRNVYREFLKRAQISE